MGWRSSLYPEDWVPGYTDAQGRFLHDFSHAGYHRGEVPLPEPPPGPVIDATAPPYGADSTGTTDATAGIRQALADAGAAGGGVVYLPPGTYRVAPPGTEPYALLIDSNRVVLRGAGPESTFILNTATDMRGREVIRIRPSAGDWLSPVSGTESLLTEDVAAPATVLPVTDASLFAPGDRVIVRSDWTSGFIADHGMTGIWKPDVSWLTGPVYSRQIVAVDTATNRLTVDIPTRYVLKTRDRARVYKTLPQLEEVGVSDLSLGNVQHPGSGWGDGDYDTAGTGAYDVHGSHLIRVSHTINGWIHRVHTFRPAQNTLNVHMLSNGFLLSRCIGITVSECVVQRPQYEGGGGNGYGYTLWSNDCLIRDSEAVHTRHNYDFKTTAASGNVISRCTGREPRLSSDYHMYLSIANLFDATLVDGDWLQARYRPYGDATNLHGHSATECVFWNTTGTDRSPTNIVESMQWGWGYVIGTSGPRNGVLRGTADGTAPEDFLEGKGTGNALEPESLYEDQFARRTAVLPRITNAAGALAVDHRTADLRGELVADGGSPCTVTVYHGRADGGTDPGRWETALSPGEVPVGPLSVRVTGLEPETTWHYRMCARNASGEWWAPQTAAFTTGPGPAIEAEGIAETGARAARLLGRLTHGGSARVTLYWGRADGGANAAAWEGHRDLGTVSEGPVTGLLDGLPRGTRLFARWYAANADGTAWSDRAESFLTAPVLRVPDVVVAEGDGGPHSVEIPFILSYPAEGAVVVRYVTEDIDATDGSDYTGGAGEVSFPAGVSEARGTVTVVGDAEPERRFERFRIRVTEVVGANAPAGPSICTIADDDVPLVPGLDGLVLHLDADALTDFVDGDPVDAWPDLSGYGHDAVSAGSARPAFAARVFGELPAVRFDGSDDVLGAGTIRSTTGGFHAFVVSRSEDMAGTNYQRLLASWSGGSEAQWVAPSWDMQRPADADRNILAYAPTLFERSSSAGYVLDHMTVGRKADSAYGYLAGDIAEILVYDRRPSAADADAVRFYLSAKYGLPGGPSGAGKPSVGAVSVAGIDGRWAEVTVPLAGTGGAPCDVWLLRGGTDAGTTPADWEEQILLATGVTEPGNVDILLNDLQPGARHWLRARVRNASWESFSPVAVSFVAPEARPVVTEGLVVHVDASSLTGVVVDEPVGVLPDSSGHGHDATASGPARPVFGRDPATGRALLRFDGVDDSLSVGRVRDAVGPLHVFTVSRGPSASGGKWQRILAAWSGGSEDEWVAPGWVVMRPAADGFPQAYEAAVFEREASSGLEIDHLTIGSGSASLGSFLAGEVPEVLVYDRVLSAGDEAKVRAYLGAKYSLTGAPAMPGEPTVNTGPASGVGPAAATLSGVLTSSGDTPADVLVCWGTADGGTDPAAWEHADTVAVGIRGTFVPVTHSLSGLQPDTTYVYRFYARNATGSYAAVKTESFSTALPVVDIGDVRVYEPPQTETDAVFRVWLSGAWGSDVEIHYACEDLTATSGRDYTAAAGTLVVPAEATEVLLRIPILPDWRREPDEEFRVRLSGVAGGVLGDGEGICTIVDVPRNLVVSPTGDDGADGSIETPMRTVAAARDRLRGPAAAGALPPGGVTVWLAGGRYPAAESLVFGEADSGAPGAPIIYAALPGETVRIDGGDELDPAWFTPVDAGSPIWGRLDENARGNVLAVDLAAHGITDYGSLSPRGFGQTSAVAALELSVNDVPMQLARWPNPDEFAVVAAVSSATRFSYAGDRPLRWLQAEEVWFHGYWYHLWADSHVRAAAVDTANRIIDLESEPAYGIQAGQPYYALNLLEEIDLPGEWYLNRATGILYFWPPEPLVGARVTVSRLEEPLIRCERARHLRFRGLTLEGGRGTLVRLDDVTDVRLEQCELVNAGADAARVTGTDSGLEGCLIAGPGAGGVVLYGGDRASLVPGGNFVRNSEISGFGRWCWTYAPAVRMHDVGQRVEHNLLRDAPHSAVLFGGNEHRIEYNEIRNVCRFASDGGAVYTGRDWGARGNRIAFNFIHDVDSPFDGWGEHGIYLDDCVSGITVHGNVLYRISGFGIAHGGGRDNIMTNNLIVECGTGLRADARGGGWAYDRIRAGVGDSWDLLAHLLELDYRRDPWLTAYPLAALIPDTREAAYDPAAGWLYPEGCVFSRNAGFRNGAFMQDMDNAFSYYAEIADNLTDVDPLFADEAGLDLTLAPESPVRDIPGFEDIPFRSIGREPVLPVVSNGFGAELVGPDSARLTGFLIDAGAGECRVTLFRGRVDGGTDPAAWEESSALGPRALGAFSVDVTGLAEDTPYCYRMRATNDAGTSWAPDTARFDTHTPPTAVFEYTPTGPTTAAVQARLLPREPVTVINNGGLDTVLFNDNGSFTFALSDAAGNAGSATATVTWIDREPPGVTVEWLDLTRLDVIFSEDVTGAATAAAYLIDPPLTVLGVENPAARTVRLTTPVQSPGTRYEIRFAGPRDPAGNAPDEPAAFTAGTLWTVSLDVGGTVSAVSFGEVPGATDGQDAGVDAPADDGSGLPALFVESLDPGAMPAGEWVRDCRAPGPSSRWRLVVSQPIPEGVTARLLWDVAGADPGRELVLQPLRDEAPFGPPVDMRGATDLPLAASGVFEVIHAPAEEADCSLARGWNLVGLPILTGMPSADLLTGPGGEPLTAGTVWAYADGGYAPVGKGAPLAAEVGYWVFASAPGRTRPAVGVRPDGRIRLAPGWSLVSPVKPVPAAELQVSGLTAWGWDAGAGVYRQPGVGDDLLPGIAYWILNPGPQSATLRTGD